MRGLELHLSNLERKVRRTRSQQKRQGQQLLVLEGVEQGMVQWLQRTQLEDAAHILELGGLGVFDPSRREAIIESLCLVLQQEPRSLSREGRQLMVEHLRSATRITCKSRSSAKAWHRGLLDLLRRAKGGLPPEVLRAAQVTEGFVVKCFVRLVPTGIERAEQAPLGIARQVLRSKGIKSEQWHGDVSAGEQSRIATLSDQVLAVVDMQQQKLRLTLTDKVLDIDGVRLVGKELVVEVSRRWQELKEVQGVPSMWPLGILTQPLDLAFNLYRDFVLQVRCEAYTNRQQVKGRGKGKGFLSVPSAALTSSFGGMAFPSVPAPAPTYHYEAVPMEAMASSSTTAGVSVGPMNAFPGPACAVQRAAPRRQGRRQRVLGGPWTSAGPDLRLRRICARGHRPRHRGDSVYGGSTRSRERWSEAAQLLLRHHISIVHTVVVPG